MRFHEYARTLRGQAHLKRESMALGAGCSTEHIRKIELGKSRPSPELFARMLKTIDATPLEESRGWLLLAESHVPDKIRRYVEVHTTGAKKRAADAAVEWIEMNLEMPDGEEYFLRAHIEQRMKI